MPMNRRAMARLLRLLEKKPLTVSSAAKTMKCSPQVTHKRIKMLQELGCKFLIRNGPKGARGPAPLAFKLKPNRASKKFLASA